LDFAKELRARVRAKFDCFQPRPGRSMFMDAESEKLD